MNFIEKVQGDSPILLAFPHTGTDVPEEIWEKLNNNGKALSDTDWHIHKLYDGLVQNVSTIRTRIHRYVIDVNRDPSGASLYPGQNTTTLCPHTDFDGQPIWKHGCEPGLDEVEQRTQSYHQPYHDAIAEELSRIQMLHGYAILYDCHSIRSLIPFLFDGKLPDFNIGTNDGRSCSVRITNFVKHICDSAQDYTTIVDGRFKGGWTTRHYGKPVEGLHAIQMELAQSTYMTESAPWDYQENLAKKTRKYLGKILEGLTVVNIS
jgi:formiminoglutamase